MIDITQYRIATVLTKLEMKKLISICVKQQV